MNCHSMTRVFQVPEIAPKEERRVLNVRKRRFEGQDRVPGKAARRLNGKVRSLGKLLIESGERGIRALAVLTRIQAQRLVGLVHT